jgi:hypothetical protein
MAVFDLVPSPFPLEVRLDHLPAKFILKPESRESSSALMLLSLWAFAAVFIIQLFTHPLALVNGTYDRMTAGVGVIMIIGVAVYFGRKIRHELAISQSGISVTIDDRIVHVSTKDAPNDSWSCPLSQFAGLTAVSLGTKLVNGNPQPLVALMLQHEDETRSVPLIITRSELLSNAKVEEFAHKLDMPILTPRRAVSTCCG